MASTTPMTPVEVGYIDAIRARIDQDVPQRFAQSCGGLKKPLVECMQDPARTRVNDLIVDKIWWLIVKNSLSGFYTQARLNKLVWNACMYDYRELQATHKLGTIDVATDLCLLSLYDVVIIGDDSSSMKQTKGESEPRWDVLKKLVKSVAYWATLFDDDGISVRLFNNKIKSRDGDNLLNPDDIDRMFSKYELQRGTPMGKSIKRTLKELEVDQKLKNGATRGLEKPVLLLIITDGIPDDEEEVVDVIEEYQKLGKRNKRFGAKSIAYGFTQIGDAKKAIKWLGEIDNDPVIGESVDATSRFNIEAEECLEKMGVTLTREMHLVKIMVGAINPLYDALDADDDGSEMATAATAVPPAPASTPFVAPADYTTPNFVPGDEPPPYYVGSLPDAPPTYGA